MHTFILCETDTESVPYRKVTAAESDAVGSYTYQSDKIGRETQIGSTRFWNDGAIATTTPAAFLFPVALRLPSEITNGIIYGRVVSVVFQFFFLHLHPSQ